MKSNYISLLVILLIWIIFVSGCVSQDSSTAINNKISNLGDSCRSIIPDRIKLECKDNLFSTNNPPHIQCAYVNYTYKLNSDGFHIDEIGTPINYYWADGTPFGTWAGNLKFWEPNKPGENVNYLYLNGMILGYTKENIAPDGTILKSKQWNINIAINPKDKTDDGYKVVQYTCGRDNTFKTM